MIARCFLVSLLGASAVAGCASAPAPPPPLAGTAWQLVRFQGGDDRVLVAGDRTHYTLSFASDGALSARIACNRGRGQWTSERPGQLALGPIAMTRAMCPPEPLQERLVKDLAAMRSYVVRDGRLFISLFADGGIYEFEPLPAK
jgi:para-nitrobenzyl esterase